jgi:hypothetical protein
MNYEQMKGFTGRTCKTKSTYSCRQPPISEASLSKQGIPLESSSSHMYHACPPLTGSGTLVNDTADAHCDLRLAVCDLQYSHREPDRDIRGALVKYISY